MLGALSRVTGWRGGRALSVSRSIHSLIKYDHDIGGSPSLTDAKIDTREETILLWERKVDATLSLLVSKKLLTTDELRRAIEGLPAYHQNTLGYYEKWAIALSTLMLENGVISHDDLLPNPPSTSQAFKVGDMVKIKSEIHHLPWPKPHIRAPGYVHGAIGEISGILGEFPFPELLAYRRKTRPEKLYRVKFLQKHLWPDYNGSDLDKVSAEIYAPWISPSNISNLKETIGLSEEFKLTNANSRGCQSHLLDSDSNVHSHGHGKEEHSHGGDGHVHLSRDETEQAAIDLERQETPAMILARRLHRALERKGVLTKEELWKGVDFLEQLGENWEGPRLVAKAWCDSDFETLLLSDATQAAKELGIEAVNSTAPTVLTVLKNTPQVHNLVVCTLCSCYPRAILGLSPSWYRSRSYRSRAIRDPRSVLREFGTVIPDSTEITVNDSTADHRYMVLPMRPKGSEDWTEDELKLLVSRNSMIGVSLASDPLRSAVSS